MTCGYRIGDVFERLAEIPDGTIDLILTSPPFLALRSYLPADHPDKAKEIGSEPDPAAFIDTLLALSTEWRRVLAPHGSIAIELGDTYAGGGGWTGTDPKHKNRTADTSGSPARDGHREQMKAGGWPLAKSLALIPELYRVALAYGLNPLTGQPSPAGQWRVRNVVRWHRPNPPVGALGDKYRPSTSDMVIACTSAKRWFDLDAVRTAYSPNTNARAAKGVDSVERSGKSAESDGNWSTLAERNDDGPGAPPLDTWVIPTAPYKGRVVTSRREPCGPLDGGERITSADCPVHADLPGQLPRALRDERARSRATDTPHTDGRLDLGPVHGSESTDESRDHSGSSHAPTSATPDLTCADAASPHSTPSHRTDPAPSTNPAGKPSAETLRRTDDTSEPPASSEPHHGTPESRTSAAASADSPTSQTTLHTVGTGTESASSVACTCSFTRVVSTESTSHYATFPPALCTIPIRSMCPQSVCLTCGEPRRRIVGDATYVTANGATHDGDQEWRGGRGGDIAGMGSTAPTSLTRQAPTLGWTDCGHDNWRNGVVLDPFAGSGTTLQVANGNGRDSIGIDLDERNAELARGRLGMFLTVTT